MIEQLVEILGTITALLAVWLNTQRKVLAWPIGIISCLCYAYFFYRIKLYSDALLQFYFISQSLYGWIVWKLAIDKNQEVIVKDLNAKEWLYSIFAILLINLGLGYYFSTYTDADLPYYDGFTTASSIVAQLLLVWGYKQNWLIWIVVDCVATAIYLVKEAYITAILYSILSVIAVKGWLEWEKQWKEQLRA